jgi:hypothetical protein
MADDFKTMDGKEYKNATVTGVEPDGIVVKTKSGISKLYFVQLPKEVQQRFNYNPQGAATYSAQQAIQYEINRKQQEAARYNQEDVEAQNRAIIAQQQAANANAQVAQDNKLVRQQQETARETNRHQEATDAINAYRATHTHKDHSR